MENRDDARVKEKEKLSHCYRNSVKELLWKTPTGKKKATDRPCDTT